MSNLTASEQEAQIQTVLEEYENNLGLPQIKSPGTKEELNQYLEMNRDHIEKLSPEDCAQIAIRLSQYAFYLQRLTNRESARETWAKHCLNSILSKQFAQYSKFMKHEVKMALAIQDNSHATALNKIANHAEQRKLRLHFLASSIKNLADILLSVQRAKSHMLKNTGG